MLVVDASALVVALTDDGAAGDTARSRLRGEVLTAPHLVDLEVTSVLRRLVGQGSMDERRATLALTDLRELPLERAGHRDLIDRIWALRHNVTVYDASYVALADLRSAILVTGDRRLARSPGLPCVVELLVAPTER